MASIPTYCRFKIRFKNHLYILALEYCPKVVLVNVFVLSSDETVQLKLDPDDTVAIVKLKIHQQLKIPLNEQRLIYAGLELENEYKLFQYSIQKNSTLQLLICKLNIIHLEILFCFYILFIVCL